MIKTNFGKLKLTIILGLLFIALACCVYFIPQVKDFDIFLLKNIQKIFSFIPLNYVSYISDFYFNEINKYVIYTLLFCLLYANKNYAGILICSLSIYYADFYRLIKDLIARPRPPVEFFAAGVHLRSTNSFPSGHSFLSAVVFGLIAYYGFKYANNNFKKWFIVVFCILFVLLVGLSRLILGVHYLTDVIGGYLLAGFVVSFAILIDSTVNNLK